MTPRERLNADLASVLTMLAEMPGGRAPRTPIYLAFGTDMDRLNLVEEVMVRGGLVTKTEGELEITAKGREIAAKCEAFAKAKQGGGA